MANLAALAEYWNQYAGQVISGTVTCPQTGRTHDYIWKLSTVTWNGITDRVSFRLNNGEGTDWEFLLTEEQLDHTPPQVLAGFKQAIKQGMIAQFDTTEFDDIGEVEL